MALLLALALLAVVGCASPAPSRMTLGLTTDPDGNVRTYTANLSWDLRPWGSR